MYMDLACSTMHILINLLCIAEQVTSQSPPLVKPLCYTSSVTKRVKESFCSLRRWSEHSGRRSSCAVCVCFGKGKGVY
jgi:hypothetical protein